MVATKKTPTFSQRLLRGVHQQMEPNNAQGKLVTYKPGDLVVSDENLVIAFPGGKFAPLDGSTLNQRPKVVDLEMMTAAQLNEFAEGEEIDLSAAKTRDEMLKTIRTALGGGSLPVDVPKTPTDPPKQPESKIPEVPGKNQLSGKR